MDGRGDPRNAVRLAAEAARNQHAALHAVYLEVRPPDRARDRSSDAGGKGAGSAERFVRAAARKSDVALEWEIIAGDRARVARAIIDRARIEDLIVVEWGASSSSGGGGADDLFTQLPLSSGRPTLFVPARHRAETFVGVALVAWNGSRESTRAVHDALPFLESARDVMVLGVDAATDRDAVEAAPRFGGVPRLATYLSRHGIRVRLCKSYVTRADVGETIASRAVELDSDLIVMGARGHGRLGRIVLGPTTRYVLENMPVPVLMSH